MLLQKRPVLRLQSLVSSTRRNTVRTVETWRIKNKFQDRIFKMQCSGEVSILNRDNHSESSFKFYV